MSLMSQLTQTSHQQRSRFVLVVEDTQGQRIINLDKNIYSIGREHTNSIVIHSPLVSRHHATLLKLNNPENPYPTFQIIDGDLQGNPSTNGLMVNGDRCLSKSLHHKDSILFGAKAKAYYLVVDSDLSEPEILAYYKSERELDCASGRDAFETIVPSETPDETFNESALLRLASFPELLPIPVVEIDLKGKITYQNSASLIEFPDLQELQLKHLVLDGLLAAVQSEKKEFFVREVTVGDVVFEQSVHYLSEFSLIRSYLVDITQRQQAAREREELLQREQEARIDAEIARERLEFLAAASRVLVTSLDYKTTLGALAGLVVPRLADFCFFDVMNSDDRVQRVAWEFTDSHKREWFEQLPQQMRSQLFRHYPIASVLLSGNPCFVPEVTEAWLQVAATSTEHTKAMRDLEVRSLIVVPLVAHDRKVGTLTFGLVANSNWIYTDADLTLANELAYRVALALDNARAHQEVQEANRMKDEFLATLSHELRTPLNAMLGWTTLLRTRKFDQATITRALETIDRNTKSLAQLIEDVLDVSRIIRGKLQLNVAPVELRSVIDAAIETVRPAALAKNIYVASSIDSAAGLVLGDANRLQQIVWNLLTNAVKFTPNDGRVEVMLVKSEVNKKNDEGTLEYAQIRVTDTGQGISSEFLPFVFERFRQGDSSTTRTQGGLGLGLAIVRHLVELQGGTVEALSPGEGEGATFIVNLPLMTVPPPVIKSEPILVKPKPEAAIASPASLAGVRVLAVDDEPDARELLIEILEDYGAEVTTVATAQEAFLALQENPDFNVLVSDIGMPLEDGYSLMSKVRSLAAEQGGQIPAVALTGYASASDRAKALLAGFQIHVPKPVNAVELAVVVGQLAKGSKAL